MKILTIMKFWDQRIYDTWQHRIKLRKHVRSNYPHIHNIDKTACMTFHPDQNMVNGVADDTMFKRVQLAWGILSDPQKR